VVDVFDAPKDGSRTGGPEASPRYPEVELVATPSWAL
jgi:hypothetical protein